MSPGHLPKTNDIAHQRRRAIRRMGLDTLITNRLAQVCVPNLCAA